MHVELRKGCCGWWQFRLLSLITCLPWRAIITVLRFTHGLVHAAAVFAKFPLPRTVCVPAMQPQPWGRGGRTRRTLSSSAEDALAPASPTTWPRVAWRTWCCWRSPSWRLDPPGTLYVSAEFTFLFPPHSRPRWRLEMAKCTFTWEIHVVSVLVFALHHVSKSMIGLTSLFSCRVFHTSTQTEVVFLFSYLPIGHVIRLLVSYKFFVLSVEHLVSTGLEMNWWIVQSKCFHVLVSPIFFPPLDCRKTLCCIFECTVSRYYHLNGKDWRMQHL